MKTALLVIDPQRIYTDPDSEMFCKKSDKTVENINALLQLFRKDGNPVIFVRHEHNPDGTDAGFLFDYEGTGETEEVGFLAGSDEVKIDDRIEVLPGDLTIKKTRYSAFVGTALQEHLRKKKVQRVVVCGFMTNYCCVSTARHAFDLDFLVDFVSDATGTPGSESYTQDELRKIVGNLLTDGIARVFPTTKGFLNKH